MLCKIVTRMQREQCCNNFFFFRYIFLYCKIITMHNNFYISIISPTIKNFLKYLIIKRHVNL